MSGLNGMQLKNLNSHFNSAQLEAKILTLNYGRRKFNGICPYTEHVNKKSNGTLAGKGAVAQFVAFGDSKAKVSQNGIN